MSVQTAIQCTDKISGKIGSFYYLGNNPMCAISGVFPSLVELYNDGTSQEIKQMIESGMEMLSESEFLSRLGSFGYKLLESNCFNYFNSSNDNHYKARALYYIEKDTKRSAFNVDSRRDDNFKALQEMRMNCFVVHNGRIWDL